MDFLYRRVSQQGLHLTLANGCDELSSFRGEEIIDGGEI
jgi:hypothetical protein